jgi:hypothetical protein
MLYFCAFIIVHVTLVFATGAVRNLNHMYAVQDDQSSFLGLVFFSLSLVVMVLCWYGVRPLILRPLASTTGTVSR